MPASAGPKIVCNLAKERAFRKAMVRRMGAIVEAADRPRPALRSLRSCAMPLIPANQRLIDSARQRIRVAKTNPIRSLMSAPDRKVVNEGIVA